MLPVLPNYDFENLDWCFVGGEGTVRKCRCRKSKRVFAVKSVPRTESESSILFNLDHPNIIKLHDVIDDGLQHHLILDLAEGGDFFELISSQPSGYLSESESKVHFLNILGALEYIHSQGIIHFDLKPENIFLLDNGSPVLADFGLAAQVDDVSCFPLRSTGSLLYTPPEILLRKPTLSSAVDIWSLGVILYIALTGSFPFQGNDDLSTARLILKGAPEYPSWLSPDAVSVLKWMLCIDPKKRATVVDLVTHPWFESLYAYLPFERLPHNLLGISPKMRACPSAVVMLC